MTKKVAPTSCLTLQIFDQVQELQKSLERVNINPLNELSQMKLQKGH